MARIVCKNTGCLHHSSVNADSCKRKIVKIGVANAAGGVCCTNYTMEKRVYFRRQADRVCKDCGSPRAFTGLKEIVYGD